MARRRYKLNHKKRISGYTVFGVLVLCTVLCSTLLYKRATLNAQSREYSKQITELK